MKKFLIALNILTICYFSAAAQEFTAHMGTAKKSYKEGKLDDARFAMEQALQEIDIAIGKEILKLLPAKMEENAANMKKDNVSGSSGFLGVTIHREYGDESKDIRLEIIGNSPLLAGINSLLSLPLIGAGGDNTIIKVGGYKGILQRVARSTGEQEEATETEADKKATAATKKKTADKSAADNNDYELQLPMNSALITFRAPGYSKDQVIKMINTIPVADIAKMLQ